MPLTSIAEILVSLTDSDHAYIEDLYINAPPHFSRQHIDAIALIKSSKPFEARDSLNDWLQCLAYDRYCTKDDHGVIKSVHQLRHLNSIQSNAIQSIPFFSGFITEKLLEDLYAFVSKCTAAGEELDQELMHEIKQLNPDQYKIISCFSGKAQSKETYCPSWFSDIFSPKACTEQPVETDVPCNNEIKQDFDLFLNWLEQYKENINQLVSISVMFGDEYYSELGVEDKGKIKFWGDISTVLFINGSEFRVTSPCDFIVKKTDGKLDIETDIRDTGSDIYDQYTSLFTDVDVNKIPKEQFDMLLHKLDQTFHSYFDIEKIPMWKDRLLNSLCTDDFLERLIETHVA